MHESPFPVEASFEKDTLYMGIPPRELNRS